jgi:putative endonuclease
MRRRDTGILGDKIAGDYLQKRGYRILETNYRCPHGEIDIVARHEDYLVFIEVRTKKSRCFGSPEESITHAKRQKLIATAWHYRQAAADPPPLWRIDTVAVELNRKNEILRIELTENAVTGDEA